MTNTVVILKSGLVYSGPVWTWRPSEGWFSLVLDPTHYDHEPPERFELSEVDSATAFRMWVSVNEIKDVDLLERARREGWVPAPEFPR